MKKVLTLGGLLLLCVLAAPSLFAQTGGYQKKVLIEEFTGAWCGWCPDGMQVVYQLKDQHGDRIIPVLIHNRDAMSLSEGDQITQMIGVSGFPSAAIDRAGNPVAENRGAWASSTANRLRQTPSVGLTIEQEYDPQTRDLKVTVYAEILRNLSGDTRFNCYLTEDSLSGSGAQWDQANYTNDTPSSMWYRKGNPMRGFMHMHALRSVLSPVGGVSGVIPANATAGSTYSYEFTRRLDTRWNADRMHVVAFVHRNGGEVYNAESQKLGFRPCTEETAFITGRISYRGIDVTCDSCLVEALQVTPGTREFTVLASVYTDSNGDYSIELPRTATGIYLRAKGREGSFMPSYRSRQAVVGFAGAQGKLPCGGVVENQNIELQLRSVRPGPGRIRGTIRDGAGKNAEIPMPYLSVVLSLEGVAVSQTETDEEGVFTFDNIEPGDYTIWVDVPGINNVRGPVIKVLADDESTTDLYFALRQDRLERVAPTSRSLSAAETLGWSVYPNPFVSSTTFQYTTDGSEAVQLRVFDLTGRHLQTLTVPQQAGTHRVEWKAPQGGVFLIELRAGEAVSMQRVVAQP